MFAKIESYLHGIRRRLSRNEWAIRHLGLTPSEGTSEAPGLLLIQIDGLGRAQLERALAAKRMPFLQRLLKREGYELHTFYQQPNWFYDGLRRRPQCRLSSTTASVPPCPRSAFSIAR